MRLWRRRSLTALLPLFCALLQSARCVAADSAVGLPAVQASSAILVDAETGQVLYERNADVKRAPASTTKIMTAILLLENTQPDDILVAPKHIDDVEGSSLHLQAGEKITARDMLYALMLRSANDGCVVIANHVAGSEAKFAEMMTAKAREIGATNTVFHNCNGLNEHPNLTTARDLATMARYACRFPEFCEAVRAKLYTVKRSSGSKDTLLKNHARFLWKFPGADGIKTGYTVPAGHCFVGGATWRNWRLISVVLHSPDIVAETSRLMKYGFFHFESRVISPAGEYSADIPVLGGQVTTLKASTSVPIRCAALKGENPEVTLRPVVNPIPAPIAAGAIVGRVQEWADGRMVCAIPLVATADVPKSVASAAVGAVQKSPLPFVLMGAVVIYGTAFAKTARSRRNRFKTLFRSAHRRRQSHRQRR